MAVLLELVSKAGKTVSREDIVSSVWPHGYVTDDVLNRCISQLRLALADDSKNPAYIATVPRKGYRLVAEVKAPGTQPDGGMLVLPFQNLAAHGQDEYLADGLTDLLIARLAVALNQRVISRTTAMKYKGNHPDVGHIREELGVKWIVEGSLLQLGGQLQVVVQLIDAKADAHAWAETWTRPAADIMGVLNEVTRNISTQINERLSGAPPAPVEAAALPDELMRRYLQGMHHASRRAAPSLRQAMVCFREVLDEHPDHAPALAGLAQCHLLLVHYGAEPAHTGIPRVRELCDRALQIDPRNAEALTHLAAVSFFHDWDFDRAAERSRSALEIRPNYEMAMLLSADVHLVQGAYEKSQSQLDRAVAADPLNVGLLMNAGDLLILQRRYAEAASSLEQALELERDLRPVWLRLAWALALQGSHGDAATALNQAAALNEEDAAYFEYKALVESERGKAVAARAAANELELRASRGDGVQPWSLARAMAAAGDADRAIAYLEKAYETRSSSMPFLGQTPAFRCIRERPEVRGLMAKAGLPL